MTVAVSVAHHFTLIVPVCIRRIQTFDTQIATITQRIPQTLDTNTVRCSWLSGSISEACLLQPLPDFHLLYCMT